MTLFDLEYKRADSIDADYRFLPMRLLTAVERGQDSLHTNAEAKLAFALLNLISGAKVESSSHARILQRSVDGLHRAREWMFSPVGGGPAE